MTNLELAVTEPFDPEESFRYKFKGSRDKNYFRSIPWPAWWDEFNSAIDKNGRRKYPTSWNFICAKTKIDWQRTLLWEMIGPEPVLTSIGNNECLRVPYLGDWDKRRRNGFYVFEDITKAKAVHEALKHRRELHEATRVLAPLIAQRMAFWFQVRDQIVESYAGKIFDDNRSVTDPEQKKRVDAFLRWQGDAEDNILRLEQQWMRIHGVDPQDPAQQWITTAALGGQAIAPAGTAKLATTEQSSGRLVLVQDGKELPLPKNTSYDDILFAHHLRGRAKTSRLPQPEGQEKADKPKPKPH